MEKIRKGDSQKREDAGAQTLCFSNGSGEPAKEVGADER